LVWTRSRLLVELRRFENSEKLRRLTLVLLWRCCSLGSRSGAARLLVPLELARSSRRLGIVLTEMEREGSARELGRLRLRCEGEPVRGRRSLAMDVEWPWKADMAWGLRNGMGGWLGAGDRGRMGEGRGVLRRAMYSSAR
jgi:hypothetical protein